MQRPWKNFRRSTEKSMISKEFEKRSAGLLLNAVMTMLPRQRARSSAHLSGQILAREKSFVAARSRRSRFTRIRVRDVRLLARINRGHGSESAFPDRLAGCLF